MTEKRDLSSHQFNHVYASLGIDVNKLGVVMLDTEPIPVLDMVDFDHAEADLVTANNPDHFWIRGAVAQQGAHVTLLYGLLQSATKWKGQVQAVLHGWSLDEVEVESVGYFENQLPDENYVCIIARLKMTPELLEGHARLEFLPHVNTFAKYRPHLTLAYVKPEAKNRWLTALNSELTGAKLATTKINYGGTHD